jgi:hypothetical protein
VQQPVLKNPFTPDPFETRGSVCDQHTLLESARRSDQIAQNRTYRIYDIQCDGEYAAATLELTDKSDDDLALVLYAHRNDRWDTIAVGYGFTCKDLEKDIPTAVCKRLSGMTF